MAIKDNAFEILKTLGGRATEKELVKKYIEMHPGYTKEYTLTKTSSEAKIQGTINAELSRNKLHKNIKVDRSKKPFEYFIVTDELNMPIVIQPIGKKYSVESFLETNRKRWAEKEKYEKEWKKSKGAIVLFTKDARIFAQGKITDIQRSKHIDYPLDYYYQLEEVKHIDYNKIIDYARYKSGPYFREYQLINDDRSVKILKYINQTKIDYLNDLEADDRLQSNLNSIFASAPERKPQKVKPAQIGNGKTVYPRNLSYAKESLQQANYKCEIDNAHVTFTSNATKQSFVEAHHLIPLSNQDFFSYSLDVPANIVALCPNCHRKIHFAPLEDKKEMISLLYNKRKLELDIFGIKVNEDELFDIYQNDKD